MNSIILTPRANQMIFGLSGSMIRDGKTVTVGEGSYFIQYSAKSTPHGPQRESTRETTKECIALQYFDGPPTKINEGETTELTLE